MLQGLVRYNWCAYRERSRFQDFRTVAGLDAYVY